MVVLAPTQVESNRRHLLGIPCLAEPTPIISETFELNEIETSYAKWFNILDHEAVLS